MRPIDSPTGKMASELALRFVATTEIFSGDAVARGPRDWLSKESETSRLGRTPATPKRTVKRGSR